MVVPEPRAMPAPRFFPEDGDLFCEADRRVYRVIEVGNERFFVPVAAWDSQFRERILGALEMAVSTFRDMLEAGVPFEDARKVLPGGAMTNLEFESTFGEGEQLPP
jgi:hypothetical protein